MRYRWKRTRLDFPRGAGRTMSSAAFLLLVLLTTPVRAIQMSAHDAGSWTTEAPLRNSRSAHSVVSDGVSLYALAGSGVGDSAVLEVERYDGARWLPETRLPNGGVNAPAAVVLNGRIYLIGGFSRVSNMPTDKVSVYDIASRTWSDAAPLPAPRGGFSAVVLNGKIHAIGGGNNISTLALHSEYDPASNTWRERAPLPFSRGSPAGVVAGDRIYMIGGRSGPSDFGNVDIYDEATDKWTAGPPIEPRGTAGVVLYRDAIYVFGGESQALDQTLGSVLRLDLRTNTWSTATTLPAARNYGRAALLNDAVYVVGGSTSTGDSHALEGSTIVERYYIKP